MNSRDLIAANRYAHALFDIARLTHQDEVIEAELESFSEALRKAPELEDFLLSPKFFIEQKRKLLQKIYQEREKDYYELLVNFFTLLLEKSRFNLIHEIAIQFKRIADEAQGQAIADIKSAVPLTAQAEKSLVQQIERLAGYKIEVRKEIDPALVGGVMVRVRNRVLDSTVKYKIEQMKKELLKRN